MPKRVRGEQAPVGAARSWCALWLWLSLLLLASAGAAQSEPPLEPASVTAAGGAIPVNGGLLVDQGSYQVDGLSVMNIATGELAVGRFEMVSGPYWVWLPENNFLPPATYAVTILSNGKPLGDEVLVEVTNVWNWAPPPTPALLLRGEVQVDVREAAREACCNADSDAPYCVETQRETRAYLTMAFLDQDPDEYLNQFLFSVDGGGLWTFPPPVLRAIDDAERAAGEACRTLSARHIASTYEVVLSETCVSLASVPETWVENADLEVSLQDPACVTPPPGYETQFCSAKVTCAAAPEDAGCSAYAANCTPATGDDAGDPTTPVAMPAAGAPAPAPTSNGPAPGVDGVGDGSLDARAGADGPGPDEGELVPVPNATDDGAGCGCRLAGPHADTPRSALLLLGLLALARSAKRRRSAPRLARERERRASQ